MAEQRLFVLCICLLYCNSYNLVTTGRIFTNFVCDVPKVVQMRPPPKIHFSSIIIGLIPSTNIAERQPFCLILTLLQSRYCISLEITGCIFSKLAWDVAFVVELGIITYGSGP